MSETLSEERAAEIAKQLTQKGSLIELTVTTWSGKTKLVEEDLGLEGLTDAELHRLGRRCLVPTEELSKITKVGQRARKRISTVSFPFPIGNARFVPDKVIGNLLADLSEIKKDFDAAVAEFCTSFTKLAEDTKAAWLTNARRIKKELGKDAPWLSAFEMRLEQAYPTLASVQASFSMEWQLFQFAMPKRGRMQLISASEALEAAKLAEEARARLEAKVTEFVGEAAVELRRRAGECCRHVAEQVRKSGEKVSERTLQPLRELIDQFKAIDFTGDDGFAGDLEKLREQWLGKDKEAGIAEHAREDADYREELASALTTMADRAVEKSEAAAAEALERFLKYGTAGRAVAS